MAGEVDEEGAGVEVKGAAGAVEGVVKDDKEDVKDIGLEGGGADVSEARRALRRGERRGVVCWDGVLEGG